jgi:hypothetical protein
MKIKGQGAYEDSTGNKHNVLGYAELMDRGIKSVEINGSLCFEKLDVDFCRVNGTVEGKALTSRKTDLRGKILIEDMYCDELYVAGSLFLKTITAHSAKIIFGNAGKLDCIKAADRLKIDTGEKTANIDLDLRLPFLKLKLSTTNTAGSTIEARLSINKISSPHVELYRCDVGELVCTSGTLKDCCVDLLVCADDIAVDSDCVIKRRVKDIRELT